VIAEAFADRGYLADGTLQPRGEPGSILDDAAIIAARAVRMVHGGEVVANDGSTLAITAQSLCVHGDTPGAVAIAQAVRRALTDNGVVLASFVS
jgi:UPF0271 protein